MEHGAVCVIVRVCSLLMRLRWPADNLGYFKLKVCKENTLKIPAQCHFLSTDEVAVLDASVFEASSGPIFLDRVQCTGIENNILDCANSALHMCSHQNDVAIICHRKHCSSIAAFLFPYI